MTRTTLFKQPRRPEIQPRQLLPAALQKMQRPPQDTSTARAGLIGADIPAGFTLPTLESVRNDVKIVAGMLSSGRNPCLDRVMFVSESSNGMHATSYGPEADKDNDELPIPLAWNALFPNLFKFSYFCLVGDVPGELMHPVIWALKMFLRVLMECTDEQLYNSGHYLRHQQAETVNRFMISNTRIKLWKHLMDPSIDRPTEALPYLEAAIELCGRFLEEEAEAKGVGSERPIRPWLHSPVLYSTYSNAKVWAGQFDSDAEVALEHVIEATEPDEGGTVESKAYGTYLLSAKINLIQVLMQRGKPETDYREYEDWVVKFLGGNPTFVSSGVLVQLLGRPSQLVNPVLTRLGGKNWLKRHIVSAMANPRSLAAHLYSTQRGTERRQTVEEAVEAFAAGMKRKEEQTVPQCRQCGACEPSKTLSRCSGCQHTYYCSQVCQKANWKRHKAPCRKQAAERAQIASLPPSDNNPPDIEHDFSLWREYPSAQSSVALSHALNLHHSPARGRTHIVVREVEYAPMAPDGLLKEDFRDRFDVVGAGVFKIEDLYGQIETALGLAKCEGRAYVEKILAESDSLRDGDSSDTMVPMLDLTFGEGIASSLCNMPTTIEKLKTYAYDPHWRNRFSTNGMLAEELKLASGALDAEHDF